MTYTKEIAIAGIIIVEITALLLGHNGVILAGVISILAYVAGFEVRMIKERN